MGNSSLCKVDLQRDAGSLAVRLSSMKSFVDAAQDLLTVSNLSAPDRQRYAKKIITLIEIAHATLTRAGLKLHTFTTCPTNVAAHKDAYFNLLRTLEAIRSDVDHPNLRGRISRLLFPLYSWFIIHRGEGPSNDGLQPPCSRKSRLAIPAGLRPLPLSSPSQRQAKYSALMPPPDAFPNNDGKHEAYRPQGRSCHKPVHPVRPSMRSVSGFEDPEQPYDSIEEQDDDVPATMFYRPPSRHKFGIFCTGKKSGVDYQRAAGHPQIVETN